MKKNETSGCESARNRIDALLAKIGDQLSDILSISDNSDVDAIVAEQDKSEFIFNQAELIEAYKDAREEDLDRLREESKEAIDYRDEQINTLNAKIEALEAQTADLEEKLKSSKSSEKYYREKWYSEEKINKELKAALKHLTAALATE